MDSSEFVTALFGSSIEDVMISGAQHEEDRADKSFKIFV
jgi:hypothetical protein